MPDVVEKTCVCPACGGVCKLGSEACTYCGSPFVAALGPGTQEGDAASRVVDLAAKLAKKPNDPQLRYELGKAWHESGEYDKAQEQLDAAVQLDPKKAEAFYLLAWNAAIAHGWSNIEVERQARFALAARPLYAEAEALIHISHGVKKQLFGGDDGEDEALAEFQKAASIDPQNAYGWYFAGILHERRGELEEARTCLEKAATDASGDLAPGKEDAKIFARLGMLCAELDDAEGAKKYLADAVALDPDNDAARDFLEKLR